ncbi:MAG: hypothetical protein K9I69_01885 [Ignavibacteriales bacterium]|nr:hypothetical protein [Ignavibacteriales bacterium]MCF8305890.1 hypothetical protein [Ignavibacteriales bacterium]MCF8315611.1 hypothetical protein [Ignavibacteriales bacterium]MCF8437195.1 hypothetical protein [Ignavibacteriales bacterium]
MTEKQIIHWLLEGDVAIQYQVHRDLLGEDRSDIQLRIEEEGWGRQFLSARNPNGHWGERFYQPKWISTHYTLLDLRCLNPGRDNSVIRQTIALTLKNDKSNDGGIRLGPSTSDYSDVCVNGMFLNYASYFKTEEKSLHSVVDSLLKEIMPDGGFNCRTTRCGAKHSSLHSTISVLEGLTEFLKAGFGYRRTEIQKAIESAEEFLLIHRLYLSDRTGKIISDAFLKLHYPCRWKYDILRALDYFQYSGRAYDFRMNPALEILERKQNKAGTWNLSSAHPGQTHFLMEQSGKPSRWNTLRALRVLKNLK